MMEGEGQASRLGGAESGQMGGDSPSHDTVQRPRKERERAMHRDNILDAAKRLLDRKSYNEITVQEVAAESEFSVGYIYKIFESKEDIYVALIRNMGDDLIHIIDTEISGSGGFEERLRNLVDGVLGWLDANPAFTGNHVHEIHCLVHTLPRLAAAHAEREEILQDKIQGFFEDGLRSGVVEGDVEIMTRTLKALVWGFIGEDMLHGGKKGKWTEYTPVFMRVFMRAFAPEGGPR